MTLGIIPARAGFTGDFAPPMERVGDHPRSRGVYPPTRWACGRAPGSSPLARGLPTGAARGGELAGIIPARAGFTSGVDLRGTEREDHPRSRGVYRRPGLRQMIRQGSSPLARGLLEQLEQVQTLDRIIPARAGFTRGCASTLSTTPDHPRSRGVYGSPAFFESSYHGSSPLARGLLCSGLGRLDAAGIIPARAGFTRIGGRRRRRRRDHPRSRGVYRL